MGVICYEVELANTTTVMSSPVASKVNTSFFAPWAGELAASVEDTLGIKSIDRVIAPPLPNLTVPNEVSLPPTLELVTVISPVLSESVS